MKKILSLLAVTLLPLTTFAQNYSYRMMNGYDYSGRGMFGIGWLFIIPLVWFIFFIAIFTFWIMMLIDAIKHSPEKTKLIWVLVIIFTHIIGALVYYFVEKKPRISHAHKE